MAATQSDYLWKLPNKQTPLNIDGFSSNVSICGQVVSYPHKNLWTYGVIWINGFIHHWIFSVMLAKAIKHLSTYHVRKVWKGKDVSHANLHL